MRIGIISDFHFGSRGETLYNNRIDYDLAPTIAHSCIESCNALDLDLVVLTGDITQDGTRVALEEIYPLLDQLGCPWYAIPGNHDWDAVLDGSFDAVLDGHRPGVYFSKEGIGMLFFNEHVQRAGVEKGGYWISPETMDRFVAAVAAERPHTLLIFSHIPLVSLEERAQQHGGKYAGHYGNGLELLDRLSTLVAKRIVIFSAHIHYHQILEGPKWIQCATGALIEYPMEGRVAILDEDTIQLAVVQVVPAAVAGSSLVEAQWVAGRAADRECVLALTIG
jgi:3',5'-cyclic AMP phosphodiesterase CpdA